MKNKLINPNVKKKVFHLVVLPFLTYWCQTWAFRKEDEKRLVLCQRKWKVSMRQMSMKTKLTDVVKRVRELKWSWAGHVCRLDEWRWSKKATEWIPIARKRKREKQREDGLV